MYPVTGASGGAILSPCDRMPAKFVTLDPCQSNILFGRARNGLNLLASPLRATLNTSAISREYWVCVEACVFFTYSSITLNSSVDFSNTSISVFNFL